MADDKSDKEVKNNQENNAFRSAFALGWEMGYTITLPLITGVILGRFADTAFGTSPLFLLSGIIVSIFVSITLLYKKVKKIIKDS